MFTISVEELQARLAGVLLHVQEQKAQYTITEQGKPVALLLPVEPDELGEILGETGNLKTSTGWAAYGELIQDKD